MQIKVTIKDFFIIPVKIQLIIHPKFRSSLGLEITKNCQQNGQFQITSYDLILVLKQN